MAASGGTLTWSSATDVSAFTGATVNDVASTPSGFVAVGSVSVSGHTNAAVWRSTDGQSWTSVPINAADEVLERVIAGGPGVVAMAENCGGPSEECGVPDNAWTSADAVTWSGERLPDCCRNNALAKATFGIVSVGWSVDTGDAAAYLSPDGVTWTAAIDDGTFSGANIGAVAVGGPGVVALGNGPTTLLAWTSSDGRAWKGSRAAGALAAGEIRDMATLGSMVLGVGRSGSQPLAVTSTDGLAWTRGATSSAMAGAAFNRVAVIGSTAVAVGTTGSGGGVWESTDGLTWTPDTLPSQAAQLTAVAASATTVVAFGVTTNQSVVVLVGKA